MQTNNIIILQSVLVLKKANTGATVSLLDYFMSWNMVQYINHFIFLAKLWWHHAQIAIHKIKAIVSYSSMGFGSG